jgi:FkbM family methyltransferase
LDIEEERIVSVYKSLASKASTFIDIGVNKGHHSSRMLDLCPEGHVFGVEANPVHVNALRQRFSLANNYTLIPNAVVPFGTDTEKITFKVSAVHHGRGGIKGLHIWEVIDPSIVFEEVEVKTVQFDSLIARAGSNLIFIKMDIEGPEYSILYQSRAIGRNGIKPSLAIENSVHGLSIAGISFEDFYAKINGIGYVLISTSGEIVTSEIKRRKSGQTIFLAPEESAIQICTAISKYNQGVA